MKFGSVCRADRAQSNGPALRSLANFNIESEQFCCSLTAALACILSKALFKRLAEIIYIIFGGEFFSE